MLGSGPAIVTAQRTQWPGRNHRKGPQDMPKYRLKASVGWNANSETDFGVEEFDDLEEAQQAAFESAAERLDAWAEEITDDDQHKDT